MCFKYHHGSIGPTESLFFVFFEISRREASSQSAIDVDYYIPTTLDPKSELRIFTDKSITPFLFVESFFPYEAHSSVHDDRVRLISDNHSLFIK